MFVIKKLHTGRPPLPLFVVILGSKNTCVCCVQPAPAGVLRDVNRELPALIIPEVRFSFVTATLVMFVPAFLG